jgi:hypothetical protein
VLPEDSAQFTSQKIRFPASRHEDVIYRLDALLSKASSARTTRTLRPNLPLCREASNCSSLHPSEHFSSTSGRLSVFDKLQDFFPKHSYGKFATTVQTTWIPVWTRSSIRQVSHSKSKCLDVSPLGPNAQASDMKFACIRSTVRTTIPSVWTCESLVWKILAAEVRLPGRRGLPFGRGSKQERISAKFLESRSHSCPSGRPMNTFWTAPRFYQAKRSFEPSTYK